MAKKDGKPIKDICHPYYMKHMREWRKYRLTYEGGEDFLQAYLKKYSTREDNTDFENRRAMSYVNAQAKAAVLEVRNAIHSRMFEILRNGGPDSYQEAMRGLNGGVDLANRSMNNFMATEVLDELLPMSRVGVFIDKPGLGDNVTLRDTRSVRPYLYTYPTEAIKTWTFDESNKLIAVLLKDCEYDLDDETGLICGLSEGYRLLELVPQENGRDVVRVTLFDSDSCYRQPKKQLIINIPKIPFVIFEINQSLLTDIADYQIALTNMSSSDTAYVLHANFPFYTEQFDFRTEMASLMRANGAEGSSEEGTAKAAATANDKQIKVGTTHGRRYPKETDRPGFIHPSSEPLQASMAKQESMKAEIRQLLNLSLNSLNASRRASSESKAEDQKGRESGLGIIAFELEAGEREIAEIWAYYEGADPEDITVNYPAEYSLKSDDDRKSEAIGLLEQLPKVPSISAQRNIAYQAARLLIGTHVSNETMQKVHEEIEAAEVLNIDPEVIQIDHEQGLVSTETASKARLYPDGEVEKAKKDHAERIARIQAAQTKPDNPAARGVTDMAVDNSGAKEEKDESQNRDLNPDNKDLTRGEAD